MAVACVAAVMRTMITCRRTRHVMDPALFISKQNIHHLGLVHIDGVVFYFLHL